MKKLKRILLGLVCSIAFVLQIQAKDSVKGFWISSIQPVADSVNTWIAFRKDLSVSKNPKDAVAIIAADTKYWLWVNGKLVVFEGGLKRGPSPKGTYYDKVNIAPYLNKGTNRIAVLLWHFGKSGFSHLDSGRSGLFFSLSLDNQVIHSDKTWRCRIHPSYTNTGAPFPNYRLPESNLCFDARKDITNWQQKALSQLVGFEPAVEIAPWENDIYGKMVERPIPQWKNFGIKEGQFVKKKYDTYTIYTLPLPYNMQFTPVITVRDSIGGHKIDISTDHSIAGGTNNLRAEYITKKGIQDYESYGWLSGEELILNVPNGVEVLNMKYRETGYDTSFEGAFFCSDDFYNRFWEKIKRTLYVNMRDGYFDCPDRERAQWIGDFVLLMDECFCTTSSSTHMLMRKTIKEMIDWQKSDSVLYSPFPGIWDKELPAQSLAAIGRYGIWSYYMNTGDRGIIEYVYPAIRKYLALWKLDNTNLTDLRQGGWFWGDWGINKDMRLILAGWHYIALDGAACMADLLGKKADAAEFRYTMERIKDGFNRCWNGYAYRHPTYQDATDDRVQALAVIAGIAEVNKYPQLLSLFKSQYYASPYMEKYVMEALFQMGEGKFALERTKKRFAEMVNDSIRTTLYEGWGIGAKGYGGGTTNHAWSGGAQIVIARQLFGIQPLEAGYKTFLIEPQPASFSSACISIPSIKGNIDVAFTNTKEGFRMKVQVPKGSIAIVRLPVGVSLDINGKSSINRYKACAKWEKKNYTTLALSVGEYIINSDSF